MATIDESLPNINHSTDEETSVDHKHGGWITFPFLTASMMGLTLAAGGWSFNLIVYLIGEFNIKSIDATQISNVVNGCTSLFPIAGAILADSFFGTFTIISISSFVSFLGVSLFTLTSTLHSLRPPPCTNETKTTCETPSKLQFTLLYTAIALASIGTGGSRFTIATMGADQFKKAKDKGIFFNWYFIVLYVTSIIALTAIIYIQDNVGWGWGFGVALASNFIGFTIFLFGKRYYRHIKPQGSPFTNLARVVVASITKRNVLISSNSEDYYYGHAKTTKSSSLALTSSFRFLNRAALKADINIDENGTIAKPWRLCTVQQVEDLKTLIRIFPLWSTGIFLSTPIGIQSGLVVLQALTMDRHIGPHFKVPAGSFLVFTLTSTAISLPFIDRFLILTWQKITHRSITPLQRVGIGHIFNILGMLGSALVESRRLRVARVHNLTHQHDSILPMSALWLVVPLAIVGVGEAFHFPGQVGLYYQEFPRSLRSTATAMIALLIGVGFYLSTALINLVQRVTRWLPNTINEGRVDNMFWMLVVIGVLNFGYYVMCAMFYKYQNVEKGDEDYNKD